MPLESFIQYPDDEEILNKKEINLNLDFPPSDNTLETDLSFQELDEKVLATKKAEVKSQEELEQIEAKPQEAEVESGETQSQELEAKLQEPEVASKKSEVGSKLPSKIISGPYIVSKDVVGKDFSGADLSGKNLAELDLMGCNLEGADLSNSNLKKARLSRANCKSANFSGANLYLANCEYSNFNYADFFNADLTGARFTGSSLVEANFINTNPYFADLSGAKLLEGEEPKFEINVLHPKKFSKEKDNAIVVKIYPSRFRNKIKKLVGYTSKPFPLEVPLNFTKSKVIVSFESKAFGLDPNVFKKEMMVKSNKVVSKNFIVTPESPHKFGDQPTSFCVRHSETDSELLDELIQLHIDDYAFDHIPESRIHRIASYVSGTFSAVFYVLTVFQQVDVAAGLPAGTAFLWMSNRIHPSRVYGSYPSKNP